MSFECDKRVDACEAEINNEIITGFIARKLNVLAV